MKKNYPKIQSVVPQDHQCLLVEFDNGVRKLYDCKPLLNTEVFACLKNEWFFRSVQVDVGGYGISWNDEVDLSESELWEIGQFITVIENQIYLGAAGR